MRFLIATVLLLSLQACDSQKTPLIRMAYVSWPGNEPLALAQSEGLYDGVTLKAFRLGSSSEVLRAFEQEVVDVATATLDEAIVLQSHQSEPLVIFLVLDTSDGGDVIVANDAVRSLADLKGKRLALEVASVGAFLLSRALEFEPGLMLSQLQIIPATTEHHVELFVRGEVDAVVTHEPIRSQLLKRGAHVLFDSRSIPNEIVDVLVTKQAFARNHGDSLRALVGGYFAAQAYIEAHRATAMAAMAAFEHSEPEVFARSLAGLHVPSLQDNRRLLAAPAPLLGKTVTKVHTFLLNKGLLLPDNSASPKLTDSYLPN